MFFWGGIGDCFFRGIVTVRHVLLAASTGTQAADVGKTVEQKRANRMERAVARGRLFAGIVSRVRGRQFENDHKGYGTDEGSGRRSRLKQSKRNATPRLAVNQ